LASFGLSEKKEVLLHTIEETFRNIRFYYDVSYKASTWGSAAIAAFAVFLINKKPVTQLWERIAVELALLAFGFALTTVIVRCNTVTRNYWYTVTQVEIAFDTFKPGVYISDESLFPKDWSKVGKPTWKERAIIALVVPPLVAVLITSLVILLT
jgi:hypothetical protein